MELANVSKPKVVSPRNGMTGVLGSIGVRFYRTGGQQKVVARDG